MHLKSVWLLGCISTAGGKLFSAHSIFSFHRSGSVTVRTVFLMFPDLFLCLIKNDISSEQAANLQSVTLAYLSVERSGISQFFGVGFPFFPIFGIRMR